MNKLKPCIFIAALIVTGLRGSSERKRIAYRQTESPAAQTQDFPVCNYLHIDIHEENKNKLIDYLKDGDLSNQAASLWNEVIEECAKASDPARAFTEEDIRGYIRSERDSLNRQSSTERNTTINSARLAKLEESLARKLAIEKEKKVILALLGDRRNAFIVKQLNIPPPTQKIATTMGNTQRSFNLPPVPQNSRNLGVASELKEHKSSVHQVSQQQQQNAHVVQQNQQTDNNAAETSSIVQPDAEELQAAHVAVITDQTSPTGSPLDDRVLGERERKKTAQAQGVTQQTNAAPRPTEGWGQEEKKKKSTSCCTIL